MVTHLSDVDNLSLIEIKQLLRAVLEDNAALRAENMALRQENAALREEIVRLKGLPPRPPIKPSGMDQKTDREEIKKRRRQGRRGAKNLSDRVTETRVIKASVPVGARFKGYKDFFFQDLVVNKKVVCIRRECWELEDGTLVIAKMPLDVDGHFGADLKRLVLSLYHQGQTSVERLVRLLDDLGITISKRQVVRLLIEDKEAFVKEAQDVLKTGLQTASWVGADDTGALHKNKNMVCTVIGDHRFAYFSTTAYKSRLNFLNILQAGQPGTVVNKTALSYMRNRGLSPSRVKALRAAPLKIFADEASWIEHLKGLGILPTSGGAMDPVRIATEGALWGTLSERGIGLETVFLSDGAGQFSLARHARCWIHMERQIHALDAFQDLQRDAKEKIRSRLWLLYADLKVWQENPVPEQKGVFEERFREIFTTKTGYVTLDRMLERFYAKRKSFLRVLDHPSIPLHTNGQENDVRCQVTRRNLSFGTKSDAGRDAKDAMLSLMKTCRKLKISFWDYLGSRLKVPGAPQVPRLSSFLKPTTA